MRKKRNSQVNGNLSTETFVRAYKGQSQMNTSTISGLNLSARGIKIMREVYKVFGKR